MRLHMFTSTRRVVTTGTVIATLLVSCGTGQPSPTSTSSGPASAMPSASASAGAPTGAPTTSSASVITYADGAVDGGRQDIEASVGDPVTIEVRADVADEVHVHGYDLHADVTAQRAAQLSFTADIPGKFEIELEETGAVLAELTVR